MTALRRSLDRAVPRPQATVLCGVDRVLVGHVAAAVAESSGTTRVVVDAVDPADVPPGLDAVVIPPSPRTTSCASCHLRDRVLPAVARLTWSGAADHVVLVLSRETAPRSAVHALVADRHARLTLASLLDLRRLISVVDAAQVDADLASVDALEARGIGSDGPGLLPVAELVAEQLEIADVVVAAGGQRSLERLARTMATLNPRAGLLDVRDDVAAATGRAPTFDPVASATPPWARVLEGRAVPGWWAYAAEVPFDRAALDGCLSGGWPGLLRAKGWVALSEAPDRTVAWSQAGSVLSLTPHARRGELGRLPGLPVDADERAGHPVRLQRIAFSHDGGDEAAIRKGLDAALSRRSYR